MQKKIQSETTSNSNQEKSPTRRNFIKNFVLSVLEANLVMLVSFAMKNIFHLKLFAIYVLINVLRKKYYFFKSIFIEIYL